MNSFFVFLLVALPLISGFPYEILNYNAGTHSRFESGIPGVNVQGVYSFLVDGKEYKVTYQADDEGFRAQGDHLPVSFGPVLQADASFINPSAALEAPGPINEGQATAEVIDIGANTLQDSELTNEVVPAESATGGASESEPETAPETEEEIKNEGTVLASVDLVEIAPEPETIVAPQAIEEIALEVGTEVVPVAAPEEAPETVEQIKSEEVVVPTEDPVQVQLAVEPEATLEAAQEVSVEVAVEAATEVADQVKSELTVSNNEESTEAVPEADPEELKPVDAISNAGETSNLVVESPAQPVACDKTVEKKPTLQTYGSPSRLIIFPRAVPNVIRYLPPNYHYPPTSHGYYYVY